MKSIKKGKYYWHKDKSIKGAHPSYVYKKNDKRNKYCIITFTSSKGKGRTKLNKNIDPKSDKDCYVLNTPRDVRRKSLMQELKDFKIRDLHDRAKIKYISKKKQ